MLKNLQIAFKSDTHASRPAADTYMLELSLAAQRLDAIFEVANDARVLNAHDARSANSMNWRCGGLITFMIAT